MGRNLYSGLAQLKNIFLDEKWSLNDEDDNLCIEGYWVGSVKKSKHLKQATGAGWDDGAKYGHPQVTATAITSI